MKNPWIALRHDAPYVLEEDQEQVEAFNQKAKPEYRLELSLLPEPFFGSISAPVVVLNLNPGLDSEDMEVHSRPEYIKRARDSLSHALHPYPFLHLQPKTDSPGARWWRSRTRTLVSDVGFDAVANGLACVQYMPYHSRRFDRRTPRLTSQLYGFDLVSQAMDRGAEIVIMRSAALWYEVIPSLKGYRHHFCASNPRSPYLTPGNLKDNYQVVADRLRTP